MDIKNIMNKLDTYIKGYSELLEENNLLKERLNMCDAVIESSKVIIKDSLKKTEIAIKMLEEYERKVNIIFEGLNDTLDSMIKEENISIKELEQLKEGVEKLKNNLNEPTNE